jgi:CubicO group peptidase (beta-lactamase class C family)
MRKHLLILFLLSLNTISFSQNTEEKIDSVCGLLKIYFNNKDITSVYQLTGQAFKKAIPPERFRDICNNNLFPMGEMVQAVFETHKDGVNKYKTVFTSSTLAMYLSLDSQSKLQTFLFKEYVDERAKKTQKVKSDNRLLTALDKQVDSAVRPYINLAITTGVSIGILRNGKMYFYNYGETAKGNKKLPNQHTIYEIGSISKTFTATLLADAVNSGKISLGDPVSKYLPARIPALEFEGVPVTIKMLSNHSSAIPRMPPNFTAYATDPLNPYKNYGLDQLFAMYSTLKLSRTPGTTYEYSNLAVGTLGAILENIQKKSFEQLVVQKICNPLHMNDTRQYIRKGDSARFAKGYSETGKYNGQWDFKMLAAAGALRSTAFDMLLYAKANISTASPSLNKAIQLTHAVTFSDGTNRVGLGWHLLKLDNDDIFFHGGGTGGYRSYLAINPTKKFAVVVLSNTAVETDELGTVLMKWLQKSSSH